MMKKSYAIVTILFLLILPLPVLSEVPSEPWTSSLIWAPEELTKLIREGLTNNQDLQGISFKIKSLKNEAIAAGSLNDPRIGIGLLNVPTDSFSFEQEPMTQKQIFIAQKFPWFGKLDLSEKKMNLQADREKAFLKAQQLYLSRQIATNYYQLGLTNVSLRINDRLINKINQLIRAADAMYESGKGIQADVLQAHVELSKLMEEQTILSQKKKIIEDRIHELLNRDQFMPINPSETLPDPHFQFDIKQLQEMAVTSNPLLAVQQKQIDQEAVGVQLSKKNYWPDIDLKVAYGQRSENAADQSLSDVVSASAVMNIPLWQKTRQDKKLAGARFRRQSASRTYNSLKLRIPYKVESLVKDINSLSKNYYLYRDVLMLQSRQWAQSTVAAYKVGKIEFNTMINAQILFLRYELKSITYLYKIYQKRAELEELIGGPLPSQMT